MSDTTPAEFVYDPFQTEAIEAIRTGHSVIVAAPTGSGKTVVAEFVMKYCLERGESVIYTAPIKALSNQKYREFQALFPNQVGILTGDITLNQGASLVIMTTEIFHNQLLEEHLDFTRFTWIIFDEIHYLDDIERGTVWEETLIFLPPHMRILALSATIPNCRDLAAWIQTIHHHPLQVVSSEHRPVPLHFFYQCRGKFMDGLTEVKKSGYKKGLFHSFQKRESLIAHAHSQNRLSTLFHHLEKTNRLPCLYFAFSRKRCEELARKTSQVDFLEDAEKTELRELFRNLCRQFDLEGEPVAEALLPIIEKGIAFHHAGMRPTLKEVVERLFSSRLIKVIFTTETFALGVNMPARTVVFDELKKTYGRYHRPLRTRDFYQMAGRAGRRGIDSEGFIYIRLNPHEIQFQELQRIIQGNFEPIRSQFKPSYATLLNLYEKYGDRLYDIYPMSFHHHQEKKNERAQALEQMKGRITILKKLGFITKDTLTEKGHFAKGIYSYELPMASLYERGYLDNMSEEQLAVICLAMVYEPKKGLAGKPMNEMGREMLRRTRSIIKPIHAAENRLGVKPISKDFYFHLTDAMLAWIDGTPFDEILHYCDANEGEVIRYFRMTVQILRELAETQVSETFRDKLRVAIQIVNYGIIDAERQLRASL